MPNPSPSNGTDLPALLLTLTPHVVSDAGGAIWIDARGLDVAEVARKALHIARGHDAAACVGAAHVPIAAIMAATHGSVPLRIVPSGKEAAFLAPLPLTVLEPSPPLTAALASVGLTRCGEVARLTQEAVEVRFGAEGVALWRLARADDRRRIFPSPSRGLPSASLAWEDHVLRQAEPLLFVINRLLTAVCTELQTWGHTARAMTLAITLANRTVLEHPLRVARETASRMVWMRRMRIVLDQTRLSDGIIGCAVRVDAVGVPPAQQGDLFDRGFQTAGAVEEAVTRLKEDGDADVIELSASAHPLPEYRVQAVTPSVTEMPPVRHPEAGRTVSHVSKTASDEMTSDETASHTPRLVLHTFTVPAPVEVMTISRDDCSIPIRFRSSRQSDTRLLTAAGPDEVSGRTEQGLRYARTYFTCLTEDGLVVLLFRDMLTQRWYWQGGWE